MKKDNFLEFQICSDNKFDHKDLFTINGYITMDLDEIFKKNKINHTNININLKVNKVFKK